MPVFPWILSPRGLGRVLPVQLALTLLVPPIAWGIRKVFVGDLFCFLWVGWALASLLFTPAFPGRTGIFKRGLTGALALAIIVAHGAYRPSLESVLSAMELAQAAQDAFSPGREAIIAFRFWSWWMGAELAAAVFSAALSAGSATSARELRRISLTTVGLALFTGLVAVASKFNPALRAELGSLYGYVPGAYPWMGRLSGVFGAPPEAGVALGFTGVILAGDLVLSRWERVAGAAGAVCGIVISKTMTALAIGVPLMGLLVVPGALATGARARAVRWKVLFGAAAMILGIVGVLWLYDPIFVSLKIENLSYRFGPWSLYVSQALKRWDLTLLGFGFPSYHADNVFVFLFNRGGLLLLALVVIPIARAVSRGWNRWDAGSLCAMVYLALTSLTFDTLILRPVVALLIVSLIPRLASQVSEPH